MDGRPLPEGVARTARAYLAALVPGDEVSDAWHELVSDARYWDEQATGGVLRLAHQVVLQHERVTPQVAVLALSEVGVAAPEMVARILDVAPSDAEAMLAEVAASVAADQPDDGRPADPLPLDGTDTVARPRVAAPAATVAASPRRVERAPTEPPRWSDAGTRVAAPRRDEAPPAGTPDVEVPDALPPPPDSPARQEPAVRIGFDDDTTGDGPGTAHRSVRWPWLVGLVTVMVLAAVAVWLLG